MKIIFYILIALFIVFLISVAREVKRRREHLFIATDTYDVPVELFIRHKTTNKGMRAKLVAKDIRDNEYEFEYDCLDNTNPLTIVLKENHD